MPATPDGESCGVCAFGYFEGIYPEGQGVCRRFPPNNARGGSTAYPAVREADWCGEFLSALPPPITGAGEAVSGTITVVTDPGHA